MRRDNSDSLNIEFGLLDTFIFFKYTYLFFWFNSLLCFLCTLVSQGSSYSPHSPTSFSPYGPALLSKYSNFSDIPVHFQQYAEVCSVEVYFRLRSIHRVQSGILEENFMLCGIFRVHNTTGLRCLSPFEIKTPISLEILVLADFSYFFC